MLVVKDNVQNVVKNSHTLDKIHPEPVLCKSTKSTKNSKRQCEINAYLLFVNSDARFLLPNLGFYPTRAIALCTVGAFKSGVFPARGWQPELVPDAPESHYRL